MDNNNEQVGGAQPVGPQPFPEQPVQPQPMPEQPIQVRPQQPQQPQPQLQPQPEPVVPEQPIQMQQPVPLPGQQIEQPVMVSSDSTMPGSQGNSNDGSKKKNMLLIGAIAGGVALIAVVVVLIIVFLGGGSKTVSCTSSTEIMGISINADYNVRVKKGEISGGDVTINVDLKNMSSYYAEREEELVDSLVGGYEGQCKTDCKMDKDYIKGDHVKLSFSYGKKGAQENLVYAYGIEEMSAQEIADLVEDSLESGGIGDTTCKQN